MGNRSRRVALFGGTFDPIHSGHLILAEWCFAELELDQFVFIPNRIHAFAEKANSISAGHRFNMIQNALVPYKNLVVDEIEIRRQETSYTIDTIRHYRRLQPETNFYYLIGADNLADFDRWKDVDQLVKMVKFMVFKRKSATSGQAKKKARFPYLNNPVIEISSTFIRRRIADNLPFRSMVPDSVFEYIQENNLYSVQ